MRTLTAFSLLTALLLSSSCKTPTTPDTPDEMESWTMMSWIAFSPSVPDLEAGDIIYQINWSTKELEVITILPADEMVAHLPGEYNFSLSSITNEDGTNQLLEVDGTDYYLSFSEDKQQMVWNSNTNPMLSDDLPVMTFARMD